MRFVYTWHSFARNLVVHKLEPGVRYRAFWFDPVTGNPSAAGAVDPSPEGDWRPDRLPGVWDHVLVIERV